MRITNNMMLTSTLRNINDAALRLNEANERVASEKKISLPSDDPVVATRAIKYRDYVAKIEQYQSNVDDVSSWQKVTDDALSDLNDVVTQLRTYVVQASSDTLSDSDLSDIKTEVEQLMQQALDDMNASYGGRYIFGGQG
jgi:flagellar hook-associated protein 3 FlgL